MRGIARGGGRFIVEMPPRHGKSEFCSRWLPTQYLAVRPWHRVIAASYTAELAHMNGGRVRDTFEAHQDELGTTLKQDSRARGRWNTFHGGGMLCAGVGGGLTGFGGNLIIVDDPIKNAEEAGSEVIRAKHWAWWGTVLRTRLEPGGTIVVVLTRWHPDDLAGRLLAQAATDPEADQWEVIKFPAIAEAPDDAGEDWRDELGRAAGEALWPDRYPLEELRRIRASVTSFRFDSLYQQRPRAGEVRLFRREWFQVVDAEDLPRQLWETGKVVRFWDLAATEAKPGKDPDWTVGVQMAWHAGDFYVLDVVRFRASPQRLKERMRATTVQDGSRVRAFVEREGGASGKIVVDDLLRTVFRGYSARGRTPPSDKVSRAEPWAAKVENGHVFLLRGAWNMAYIDEHDNFPQGKKDQVDASSGAFRELEPTRRGGGSLVK